MSMENFVIKTHQNLKEKIDLQLARFAFATNVSFGAVDHTELKKICGCVL